MEKSAAYRIASVLVLVGAVCFLARGTSRRPEAPTTPLASTRQALPAPTAPQTAESDEPIAEIVTPTSNAVELDLGLPAKIQRSEAGLVRAGNNLCTEEFTKDGVRLTTAGGELAWSLRDIRLGQRSLLDGGSAEPALQGEKSVSYRRAAVTEAYALRGDGVEQTFVLDEQLAAMKKDGPLSITVGLRTALKPVAERRGEEEVVDLRDRSGKSVLTYGGATAIDATGRRQRMSSRLRGNDLEMTLDAGFLASATFPLTVDPIISVTPTTLTFFAPFGGPNPLPKVIKLKNSDTTGQMKWTAVDDAPWLTVKPAKGVRRPGMSKNLTVSVNVTGLAASAVPYVGHITISSPTASNSPQTVTVNLFVNDGPTILVDPPTLVFNSPDVGPNPVPQFMTVQNVGTGTLNWTAASVIATPPAGTWLSVSPSSGALLAGETVTLSVLINHAGLAAGTYTGSINVTDPITIPTPTPGSVAVTLNVSNLPKVGLAPTSLSFDGAAASAGVPTPAVPAPQQVTLTNSGAGTLVWTLSSVTVPAGGTWLTVNPTGGSLNAGESIPLDVSVNQGTNPTGLAAGTYTATVTVTDGTSTGTFDVAFNVNDLATISLDPTALTFNAPDIGPDPVLQQVTLTNSGTATLDWTATTIMQAGQTWLSVSPASGSLAAGASIQLSVSVAHGVLASGTYTANIDIADTTGNATNPDELIDVTLNVSNTPKLDVSSTLLSFQAPDIGPNPGSQSFTVTNTGGGTLTWTSSITLPAGQTWLSVAPTGSTLASQELSTLSVTVDHAGLAVGSYSGTITITAAGASNSPRTVFIVLDVSNTPKIGLSPSSMAFDAPTTGANPPPQILTVTNVGGGTLNWAAATVMAAGQTWLNVSPPSGSLAAGSSAPLTVSIDHAGLAAGTYSASIRVTDGGATNSPQTMFVTLNVNTTPKIVLSTSSLTFDASTTGPLPPDQTFTITNGGGGTLTWTRAISAGATWLTVTPAGGSLSPGVPDTLTVTASNVGLAAGAYTGTITFSAGGSSNSPQTVSVTLNVSATPRFGVSPTSLTFDAPDVGPNPADQTFTVTNTGGGTLAWSRAVVTTPAGGTWLTVTPASDSLAAGAQTVVTVSVDKTGLVAGTYLATITLTAAGASNNGQTVNVTLNVNSTPKITLSPAILTFNMMIGDPNPAPQDFTVANSGGGTLTWAAAFTTSPVGGTWLTLNPTGGTRAAGLSETMTATVDSAGLAAGSYSALITVTDPAASNNPQQVSVVLNINAPPVLAVNIPKAGYCGLLGLEVLLPSALLWGLRRLRRKDRKAGAGAKPLALFLILLLAGSGAAWAGEEPSLPRSLQDKEPAPAPPKQDVPAATPKPQEEAPKGQEPADGSLLDFGKTAIEAHLGFVTFSSSFESSAKFSGGVGVRVPSPLLSGILSSDPEWIAAFFDLTVTGVDRDIPVSDTSGTVIFATLGLDSAFYRSDGFDARVQIGAQYGNFGGVEGLDNGVAFVVGLRGALQLSDHLWLALNPQVAFGSSSDRVFFLNLGLDYQF